MTQIEEIPIAKLTLLEKNPRRISKDQMDKLIKSMQEDKDFLKCRPVLVNRVVPRMENEILTVYAGNQRVQAAKKLKWKTIPCIIEDNLSDEVMQKRIILDNKTMGEFDWDALANEFEMDLLLDCGFQEFEFGVSKESNVDEILEEQEEKKNSKKKKCCPSCGHEF